MQVVLDCKSQIIVRTIKKIIGPFVVRWEFVGSEASDQFYYRHDHNLHPQKNDEDGRRLQDDQRVVRVVASVTKLVKETKLDVFCKLDDGLSLPDVSELEHVEHDHLQQNGDLRQEVGWERHLQKRKVQNDTEGANKQKIVATF